MRVLRGLLLTACCCLGAPALGADYAEEDILHAIFAAFQEAGVFSADYIASQRQLLQVAAKDGNALARVAIARQEDSAAEPDPSATQARFVQQ